MHVQPGVRRPVEAIPIFEVALNLEPSSTGFAY